MCPETWKRFNGIPQTRAQRMETVVTGHRSGEAALLCLGPAIVMFWQQMGGHWSWLWATGGHKRANWKQITHTDSHTLAVAFTCALARTGRSTQVQDFTHTISHT